jgi:hypothetical protein
MKRVAVTSRSIEPNKRIPNYQVYFDYRLSQLIMEGIIAYGKLEWEKIF